MGSARIYVHNKGIEFSVEYNISGHRRTIIGSETNEYFIKDIDGMADFKNEVNRWKKNTIVSVVFAYELGNRVNRYTIDALYYVEEKIGRESIYMEEKSKYTGELYESSILLYPSIHEIGQLDKKIIKHSNFNFSIRGMYPIECKERFLTANLAVADVAETKVFAIEGDYIGDIVKDVTEHFKNGFILYFGPLVNDKNIRIEYCRY